MAGVILVVVVLSCLAVIVFYLVVFTCVLLDFLCVVLRVFGRCWFG